MSGLDCRPVTGIKGRDVLTRRLRGLLLAVHRFGLARATSPADRTRTATLLDQLQAALDVADEGRDEVRP